MSKYLDVMAAMTRAREQFNDRTRQLHEERGIPASMPLIASDSDEEMMNYLAEGYAVLAQEKAFLDKYHQPGVDPHSIE